MHSDLAVYYIRYCRWGNLIGNVVGALIYLSNVLSKRFTLSVSPKYFTVKDGICSGVLSIGIPASLMHLLMSLSQIFTNTMITPYGDMTIAAYGISAKSGCSSPRWETAWAMASSRYSVSCTAMERRRGLVIRCAFPPFFLLFCLPSSLCLA